MSHTDMKKKKWEKVKKAKRIHWLTINNRNDRIQVLRDPLNLFFFFSLSFQRSCHPPFHLHWRSPLLFFPSLLQPSFLFLHHFPSLYSHLSECEHYWDKSISHWVAPTECSTLLRSSWGASSTWHSPDKRAKPHWTAEPLPTDLSTALVLSCRWRKPRKLHHPNDLIRRFYYHIHTVFFAEFNEILQLRHLLLLG